MHLYSWNVNGFRAVVKNGFYNFLNKYNPDILGIQEIKYSEKPLEPKDYSIIWNPAKRKGYAGTAIFIKKNIDIKSKSFSLGVDKFDHEGRIIILELDEFYFINTYFPNSQHGLPRLDFKIEFDKLFHKHLNKLRKNKPVIACGDFNVAHEEKDIARPKSNEGNAGFTKQERDWMTKFLSDGYIDTFRYLHPNTIKYSWWSYRFSARKRNIGWRIDYFITSDDLKSKIKNADILANVLGSDHAPIYLHINI